MSKQNFTVVNIREGKKRQPGKTYEKRVDYVKSDRLRDELELKRLQCNGGKT